MAQRGSDAPPGKVSTLDHRDTAELLRDLTIALVSELDLERVAQRITDATTELTGAESGAFFYNVVDAGGESSLAHARSGGARDAFADFPPPRETPLFESTFRGEMVVRLDDVTEGGLPPGDLPAHLQPVRSYLGYPVVSRSGEVLGALFFGHGRPGVFTEQHEQLLAGVAVPAAIAIGNARLFQAAERARQTAQRSADRLAHMHAVSARLAGAKTVDEVAAVIVTGAAGALGCARASLFVLADEGRALRLLDSFGYEGDLRDRWSRIDLADHLPTTDALRDRRLVTVSGDEAWAERYPEYGAGPNRSVALAVIPLALGPHVFGVATFGWDGPRSFGDDEARFLEAVADQCAQALERARLYELERETARTLQQSLLPPRTPEIPGMEVAAVYRPGDRSVAVGGDFYDVFRLGPNRWGVAMGDVCGRGARAASRTALVRYTMRAVASGVDDPVAVLRRVNDAVLAEPEADDRFCAAVFGYVELDRCGAWVTLACAGHPRPVVVRRAGWLDVRGQPGTLIGVLDDLDVSSDRVGLGPGDSLVFYTDGISEARNTDGEQFADGDFADTLLGVCQLDATGLAAAVRQRALDFSGGTLGDDFAVLVIRVPGDAADDPDSRLSAALGDDIGAVLPGYPVPGGGGGGGGGVGGVPTRPKAPRAARTVLPPAPGSARAARRFLAGVLSSWRMPELLEGDAALLLSELATNAILHARSPFTVIVRFDGSNLKVEVGDGSRAEPELRPLDGNGAAGSAGGRGLVLVDRVASRWGILPTARGKRVWFELPVPPARG